MSDNSAPASPFEVSAPIEAPVYPLVPHDISWHDHTRIDPFYWMRGEKLFGGPKDGSEDGDAEDGGSHEETSANGEVDAEVNEDGDDDAPPAPSSDIVSKALTPHFVVADSVIKAMLKAENAYTASYLPMSIKPYDLLVAGRDPTPVSVPGSPLLALSASASSVAQALSSQGGTPSSPLLSRGGFPAVCAQKGFTPSPASNTATSSFPTLPITIGIRGVAEGATKSSAAAKREVAAALETPVSYLYKEMKSRWKQTDSSTPAMGGAYWYYSREQKGKDYHQVCRRRITDANRGLAMEVMKLRNDAIASGSGAKDVNVPFCPEEEEVLLDVNVLQEEMKLEFVDVIGPISSPCDTKMVYAVDNSNGQEIYTLYICDISPTILKAGLGKPTPNTTASGDCEDAAPTKKRFGGGKGVTAKKENLSKKLKKGDDMDDASSELSSEVVSDGEVEAKSTANTGPTCHVVRANPPVVRTIELFDCSGDVGWVDCNILAYTTLDDSQRAHRLVLHDLRLPQEEHLQIDGATTASKKKKKGGDVEDKEGKLSSPPATAHTHRHLNDIIVHDEKDARYSVGCLSCLDDECHAAFGSSSKECEELYLVPNVPSTQEMYRTRGSIFQMPTTNSSSKSDAGKGKGHKTSRGVTSRRKTNVTSQASSTSAYSSDLKSLIDALSPKSSVSEVDASTAFISATNGGVVGRTIWDYKNAIQCIVPREDAGKETDMECDASHHPYLMPIGEGATPSTFDSNLTGGFIFVANQKPKFSEFGVFYAPDSAVLATPGSSPVSHIRNRWVQLVEVKQYVTVQSIELIKDYVLLTCIDKGFPSCYVCSMDDVRRIISIQQKELATGTTTSTYLTYGKELKCVGDFLLQMKKSILSPTSSSESGASLYCVSADWGSSNFNQCYTLTASVSHISEKSQSFEINLRHFMDFFGVGGVCSSPSAQDAAYKALYDAWAEKDNQEVYNLGLLSLLAPTDEVGVAQTALLRREEVMANGIKYDASEYVSERLWVPAKGSVKKEGDEEVLVPVTLTYRKDKYIPGESPILLYLYGSYGECTDPEFNRNRLSLVDRGVGYAIVSVRGGGELGRGWRDAGRMANRLNSTLDLISVAEYLREAPLTATWRPHPNKVAIMGGSAGGTIVAAAANRRPELFCAVLADVPFVDCLTSMLDERIPLTTVEWEEWGNPVADPVAYRTILEYSPQDNVPGFNELVLNPQMDRMKADDEAEDSATQGAAEEDEDGASKLEVIKSAKRLWKAQPIPQGSTSTNTAAIKLSPDVEARIRSYPNLYVSSGLGDSRVAYWEPMAYVARVRATCRAFKAHLDATTTTQQGNTASTYHPPLILHQCELSGGHGGASGRFAYLKDIAREYAFLLHIWGIPLIEE